MNKIYSDKFYEKLIENYNPEDKPKLPPIHSDHRLPYYSVDVLAYTEPIKGLSALNMIESEYLD